MKKLVPCAVGILTIALAADHDPAHLLSDSAALSAPMDLAVLPSRTSTVYRAKQGEWQFNLHSYLAFHDGQFWAMWSSGRVNEDSENQLIRYSTSRDGHTWAESKILVDDPDGPDKPGRWIARGLFVRNGGLNALAAYVEGQRDTPQGREMWPGLRLMRFEWNGQQWKPAGVYLENCMNNYAPGIVGRGLFMTCRDSFARMHTATSESHDGKAWKVTKLPGAPPVDRMSEPSWYVDPKGVQHLVFRDAGRSNFLHVSLSSDKGKTWTAPVRSNYSDATSKNFIDRLSNGWYFLISNPNPKSRDPVAITFSKDGWSFGRPMAVRKNAPGRRFEGRSKNGGFQYPHAMEHGGSLWIIYATAKEDIEVTEIKISSLGL